jgi:hypothetical protein
VLADEDGLDVFGLRLHDVTQLLPVVDKIPRIKCIRGRPERPDWIYADRGYDFDTYRRELRHRALTSVIARRGVAHRSGLGTRRCIVAQTIALLHWSESLWLRKRTGDLPAGMLHGRPVPDLRA